MKKAVTSITVICTESNNKASQSFRILVLFEDELSHKIFESSPEYGYSNAHTDKAKRLLINEHIISSDETEPTESLSHYCEKNKIVYYEAKFLTATKDMIVE
jgi:hypothetical protein